MERPRTREDVIKRKYEINLVLMDKIGKIKSTISQNSHTSDPKVVLSVSENIIKYSEEIQKYVNEIKSFN